MLASKPRRISNAKDKLITQVRLRCSGEVASHDGDEYEVIDAEHQVQHDQGQQAQPGRGGTILFALKNASSNLQHFKPPLNRVIEIDTQVEM